MQRELDRRQAQLIRSGQGVDAFLFSLLNGTVYGLLLFMVSAGLTLVFG